MELKQFYLRLLSYDNACKIIDFINKNDKKDYANITTGGVSCQVSENNMDKVIEYLESLDCRYEITTEHPEVVNAQIIENLKSKNVI